MRHGDFEMKLDHIDRLTQSNLIMTAAARPAFPPKSPRPPVAVQCCNVSGCQNVSGHSATLSSYHHWIWLPNSIYMLLLEQYFPKSLMGGETTWVFEGMGLQQQRCDPKNCSAAGTETVFCSLYQRKIAWREHAVPPSWISQDFMRSKMLVLSWARTKRFDLLVPMPCVLMPCFWNILPCTVL